MALSNLYSVQAIVALCGRCTKQVFLLKLEEGGLEVNLVGRIIAEWALLPFKASQLVPYIIVSYSVQYYIL